jgi:glutamate racemase
MKIGIFDSGLGGLFTLKAIERTLPEYDYVYLGDTKRLPYGVRSHDEIYRFLKEGIDFLFAQDCLLIIVACNSASSEALRRVQEEYLPQKYPGKNVLGMIVPMTEACAEYSRVGLIATEATIHSGAYPREFAKRAPNTTLLPLATPSLVPLIETGDKEGATTALKEYLSHFTDIDALLLGCTHYAIEKDEIRKLLPEQVAIISQDTVVPEKTRDYLLRHPEIEGALSRGGTCTFYVTDLGEHFQKTAALWFGEAISIQMASIEHDVK